MRIRLRTTINGQRGDTIVEVLIAVALVSLILVSAYAIVNHSLRGIQAAQEQSYAQKLVEQQVEMLRSAATAPTDGCYTATSTGAVVKLSSDTLCNPQNGGAKYALRITNSGGGIYKVQATWDSLDGSQAQVTAYYERAS